MFSFVVISTTIVFAGISYTGTSKNARVSYGDYQRLNEIGRAWLCVVIVMTDLFIVVQDWQFPTFHHDHDENHPDLYMPMTFSTTFGCTCSKGWLKRLACHVDDEWASYGPLFVIICLDFKLLAAQLTYKPENHGQYFCNSSSSNQGNFELWTIRNTTFLHTIYSKGELIKDKASFSCSMRKMYRNKSVELYDQRTGYYTGTKLTSHSKLVPVLMATLLILSFLIIARATKRDIQKAEQKQKKAKIIKRKIFDEHVRSVEKAADVAKKAAVSAEEAYASLFISESIVESDDDNIDNQDDLDLEMSELSEEVNEEDEISADS